MNEHTPPPFHYEPASAQMGGAAVPILCASPHSGRHYPQPWLSGSELSHMALRKSEDVAIDQLFARVPELGMALICAQFARAYVDLNRDRSELDPALIEGAPMDRRNARIASGLGVIPRIVGPRTYIQKGKITQAEAEARLAQIWDPYHAALNTRLNAFLSAHRLAILIDLHSMPQAALDAIGQPDLDIVLGDLHGQSCAPWVTDMVEVALMAQGFRVQRNVPFAGAYNMQHYGRPKLGRHALQIEISRRLYVDESSYEPTAHFTDVQTRLTRAMADVAVAVRARV